MSTLSAATRLWKWAEDNQYCLNKRPFVLVFANAKSPGGGWRNGAMAQEEDVCYRSSLARSLNPKFYNLGLVEGIYTSRAYTIRTSFDSGYKLIDASYNDLPRFSAFTIPAIDRSKRPNRAWSSDDRIITMGKMRLALRVAAHHRHEMLVLGAFGCGVFQNPPKEIAHCWLKVLREPEFERRWRKVWFAVYDPHNTGNFSIFDHALSGQYV